MTSNELLKEYEEELINLEESYKYNKKAGMEYLADIRYKQIELVRRFIKDLKKLLV